MKFTATLIVVTLSFTAIAQAGWTYPAPFSKTASLSLPPDSSGNPTLSLPPDEQSPPIQAGDANVVAISPIDDETIRELLPRLASANDLKAVAASLTAQEKAALYKTAMVARALLIEAKDSK